MTLADKLNHLFATVQGRDGGYSNEDVAVAISQAGAVTISQSYIWQLRKGMKDNPTLKHLQALADFFGVPAAYFFEDEVTARVNVQLDTLRRERASADELRRAGENAEDSVELRTDGGDERRLAERLAEQGIRRISARYGEMGPNMLREILDVMEQLSIKGDVTDRPSTGNAGTERGT